MAPVLSCEICMKLVLDTEKAICCDGDCDRWFHADCVKISPIDYAKHAGNKNLKWVCNRVDCSKLSSAPMNQLLAQMSELTKKVDHLIGKVDCLKQEDIAPIKEDIKSINSKINALEPRIVTSENRITDLEQNLQALKNNTAPSNPEEIIGEINERSRRATNVILFNLKESSSRDVKVKQDHDKQLVAKIASTMNNQVDLNDVKAYRLGKPSKDKVRPLRLILKSIDETRQFVQGFSKEEVERVDPSLAGVSVSRDKTIQERDYLNHLRNELKTRTENGEPDLTIKYTSGVPAIVKAVPSAKNA